MSTFRGLLPTICVIISALAVTAAESPTEEADLSSLLQSPETDFISRLRNDFETIRKDEPSSSLRSRRVLQAYIGLRDDLLSQEDSQSLIRAALITYAVNNTIAFSLDRSLRNQATVDISFLRTVFVSNAVSRSEVFRRLDQVAVDQERETLAFEQLEWSSYVGQFGVSSDEGREWSTYIGQFGVNSEIEGGISQITCVSIEDAHPSDNILMPRTVPEDGSFIFAANALRSASPVAARFYWASVLDYSSAVHALLRAASHVPENATARDKGRIFKEHLAKAITENNDDPQWLSWTFDEARLERTMVMLALSAAATDYPLSLQLRLSTPTEKPKDLSIQTGDNNMSAEAICQRHLQRIDGAKDLIAINDGLSIGAEVSSEQINKYLSQMRMTDLRCPAAGTYQVGPIGKLSKCSIHGTAGDRPRE